MCGPASGPAGEQAAAQAVESDGDDERDGRTAEGGAKGARREEEIVLAMTRWCKGMAVAEWLTVLVARLCAMSPSDEAVLELAMAFVLTWGDNWLDFW